MYMILFRRVVTFRHFPWFPKIVIGIDFAIFRSKQKYIRYMVGLSYQRLKMIRGPLLHWINFRPLCSFKLKLSGLELLVFSFHVILLRDRK